ncbi:MAG: hypothetical protein HY902_04925 [Deltaproteobacteria bacterium]|nr:hypothetical protein [Deltaproteobacteria bacterium]
MASLFVALAVLASIAPASKVWAQVPMDPAAAASETALHEAGQVGQKHAPLRGTPAVASADRQPLLAKIESKIACVCIDNGDLKIDPSRSIAQSECNCPHAARVRTDLNEALAGLSTAQLTDKRTVAEQLEAAFVPMAAEYERVFRYPKADFDWWMDNVRCVCDGCKPTVFFSKCQITCHPAITYKLRTRIFFAMGFSRDEMLDYYLAEYNADKSARDQQTRDWLLPRKQRERGWVVPAVVMFGVLLSLGLSVRRWARPKKAKERAEGEPAPVEPVVDAKARNRLLDEMDRDDEGF